jgi:hypothetical protein
MCAMSPRLLRPKASGFNPKAIPGLQIWVDASVASSVTLNSGNVSQIDDLSGNSRHLAQGTAANQPAYLTNGRNGKNVIDYGATTGKSLVQTLASAFTLAQPVTFFWAYKTPASGGYTASDVTNAAFDATGRLLLYGNAGTEFRLNAGSDVLTSVTADAWLVATHTFNGSSSVRRLNTATGTTVNTGSRPFDNRLVLGANFAFGSSLRSLIGECGMYSGTLTDSQHTAILKYLANKWAVTLS